MRSTFSVLFYTKNQSLKDGKVPIMGRITINKTTACFSCKREVSLALWDAKAKRAKGKSDEARRLNQELDNIKAQITRHYQYVCDHDSLVTAKSVYNRYLGFGDDYHTLMGLFREQLASYKEKIGKEKAASTYRGLVADYKEKIGKEKAASTYRGLVADYKNLQLFLKEKRRIEDIAIAELDKKFIEDYYNWMLGTCALASSTAFGRVNTLKWLMYTAQERGWIRLHPFIGFDCLPEYKRRSFLTEEDLQSVIHVKLNYKRQRAIRDMFLFMCFTGLAYADLKEITYKNIHTDSEGGTWLMGNRIKTGVAYVVKLLPIAIELVERYRGDNEKKSSPDKVFPVGEYQTMASSLRVLTRKCGCSTEITPHIGRHTFAVLAILKGMPLETLQKVLGHKSILSTQIYAELINPKVGEDTDRLCMKIGDTYRLAN
ncbi:site-specific integrase [Phocaeicola vulgatus]|uniref:site-specific integrase n=2 Tax=Bacteroidales TaxID=171549 RepID=UPI000E533C2D|nr:site-specific integrase [Phocaeicola vulgatus]RGW04303.1 site-specific integrase [Phocaeicola vulgatus]